MTDPAAAPPPPPGRSLSAGERWLLGALLVWAFGVRLWFARTGLDPGRFVDERFVLDNVRGVLQDGSLRPVNLFYPGLGSLLQSLLLGAADLLARIVGHGGETILHDGRFTPAAYFLGRGLQAAIGVLTLYWTFRLGRRLLSPRAGLLAALALAAVPLHVRQSAVIKPDILLLLGLLLAAEATAAAIASGKLRHFLGAGAAVGLATSAKYNGVTAALPLALLTLPTARRDPAVLARLAAAGGASLLVFVLFDPYFFSMQEKFRHDFSYTIEHYKAKSSAGDTPPTHLDVLAATGPEMLSDSFHGVFTGVLGFAGLAATAFWAIRRRDRGLALVPLFPLAYAAVYAASTTYAKTNNYLPVSPFLALGAAALVTAGWDALLGKPQILRRLFAAAVLLWCLTLIWRPMAYAYEQTIPATLDVAEDTLGSRLAPLASSRVLYQVGDLERLVWVGDDDGRALVRDFATIDKAPPAGLDLADAELYTPEALASPAAAARIAASPLAVLRVEPRPFAAHGGTLTLLLHPWRPLGEPAEVAMQQSPQGAWTAALPPNPGPFPAVVSFEVVVAAGVDLPAALAVDGRPLPLFPGGRRDRRGLTERVRLDKPPAEVALVGPVAAAPNGRPPRLRVLYWVR